MNSEKKIRKIIKREIPNFWLLVIFSFVFSIIIKLAGLIPGLLMKEIVDVLIPNGNIKQLLVSIVLFVFVPICLAIGNAVYQYVTIVNGRNMSKKLSTLGFEKQVYQPLVYFDKNRSAELASYCRSESTKYILFWLMDIPQVLSSIVAGLTVLIYMVHANVYIGLSLILYIPLLLFPGKIFGKLLEKIANNIVANNSKVHQIIGDTFRAIKYVKSMTLEKIMVKRVYEITSSTAAEFAKSAMVENLYGMWSNSFVDNVFTGILFAVGAINVIKGNLTLGILVIVLNYLSVFFDSVKSISAADVNYRKHLGEFSKFFDMLTMEDERQQEVSAYPFSFKNKIEFSNVSFAYTEERGLVLHNITFNVNRGEWVGIMGYSGAGKSTIFDLLLKFYNINSGEIFIDDNGIQNIDTYDLRKKIVLVSQNLFLFPGTLRDNLLLADPTATDDRINKVLFETDMLDFVTKLPNGLDTIIGEDGQLISGGEKQRISLAIGLLRDSEILLLDEVTANLDSESEKTIRDTIQKIRTQYNLTVISISHRVEFLKNTDRILIINGGIIEKETCYNTI